MSRSVIVAALFSLGACASYPSGPAAYGSDVPVTAVAQGDCVLDHGRHCISEHPNGGYKFTDGRRTVVIGAQGHIYTDTGQHDPYLGPAEFAKYVFRLSRDGGPGDSAIGGFKEGLYEGAAQLGCNFLFNELDPAFAGIGCNIAREVRNEARDDIDSKRRFHVERVETILKKADDVARQARGNRDNINSIFDLSPAANKYFDCVTAQETAITEQAIEFVRGGLGASQATRDSLLMFCGPAPKGY